MIRHRSLVSALLLVSVLVAIVGIIRRTPDTNVIVHVIPLDTDPAAMAVDTSTDRTMVISPGAGGRDIPLLSVVNTSAGTLLYSHVLKNSPSGIAIDSQNRHAFIVYPDPDNTVDVVDQQTGRRIQTIPAGRSALALLSPAEAIGPVAVVDERARRLIITATGALGMFDTIGGRLITRVDVGADPLLVDEEDERLVILNEGLDVSTIRVADARSGALRVAVPIGGIAQTGGVGAVGAGAGRIVVAMNNGVLVLLDARNGVLIRATRMGVGVQPSMALIDGRARRAVVVAATGLVSVLDLRQGMIVRSTIVLGGGRPFFLLDPGRGQTAALCISTGRTFVGGRHAATATVSMFNTRSGHLMRTVAVPGLTPAFMMVDERSGRLITVANGVLTGHGGYLTHAVTPGTVNVLDTTTGTLLRTAAIGARPVALSIDEQAGRAIVLTQETDVESISADPWGWLPSWLRHAVPFIPTPRSVTRVVPGSIVVLDTSH